MTNDFTRLLRIIARAAADVVADFVDEITAAFRDIEAAHRRSPLTRKPHN